ncbi:BTAD domain-containing putative transcriptional regulator [Streptomyces sp. NPDC046712]|uniref:BTAD domain-containing putative transcriptional regulator n=1 Tax=Streptomyces sp. NPDC046712 TaxID=3154802 RepID=UPI0033CDB51A
MIFRLLGPLAVSDDSGAPISLGGPKVRALLALLLLNAGRTVPVEQIVDGLYGDEPPAGAMSALQSQVSRLRRVLPAPDVEFSPAGYRLAVAARDDVDALRFERLAQEGARARAAGDPVRAVGVLQEALALWQGPALADVQDAPYAAGQAARLEALRLDVVEEWAAASLALGGDPAVLVRELEEAAAAHPLRERLRGLQMRALRAAGRSAEALALYEEVRATLVEELGTDPSAELAAVHLAILRGEAAERAAGTTATAPAPVRPLPVPLTGFVGRARERGLLAELLTAARLVTLVGPGGAGKTRLALEVGAGAAGEVCFVDLEAAGAGEVARACAAALGLREEGRLTTALANRPMLLIVDNCEHVVVETAVLVRDLLTACPGLRVLATSREALGITGESLLPLAALAPDAAVELFVRRAAAARPGFTGHARVAEVCAALDGLPLAIELAAARLRSLSVDELADRLGEQLGERPGERLGKRPGERLGEGLDDRFRLLSRGDRTAPERHRTLRAVVAWSWSLLAPEERELAARLSVFRGGATAEAVERVCGADRDVLAGLAEKSLVEVVEVWDGRYRMLETIRAYAAEELPHDDPTPAAHTAYYLGLAETADPELRGAAQLEWLARLDTEDANLRAALRRAEPEAGLRMVAALTPYWWLRGLRGQVTAPAAELLARVPDSPGDLEEEWVLCVLAAGTRDPAHLSRARALLEARTEPLRQPFTAFLWATSMGPVEGLRVGDDPWSRALDLVGQGHLALARGDTEAAGALLTGSLAGFRALGERWGQATALEALASLSPEPLPLLAEALGLLESLGVAEDVVDLLHRRSAVHEAAGDLTAASEDRTHAEAVARRAGLGARS